jgi:glycosyltransferase involved in cell wall biosynthesis
VTVIAQRTGEYDLPDNVKVFSLGKERNLPRLMQLIRFWWFQWSLRKKYDRVLVHMTPIWAVLGFPLWTVLRKRVFLWYEARGTRWPLRFACSYVHKVFSASSVGMPIDTSKSVIVGHGIDTNAFTCNEDPHEKGLIVAIGRITRAKKLDYIIRAFHQIPTHNRLILVGTTLTAADRREVSELRSLIHSLDLGIRVSFCSLKQPDVIKLLKRADLLLHASETSLDKVLLEAMACGCSVLSCGKASEVLPDICRATQETFADRAKNILSMPDEERARDRNLLRAYVEEEHSLTSLVKRLLEEMS